MRHRTPRVLGAACARGAPALRLLRSRGGASGALTAGSVYVVPEPHRMSAVQTGCFWAVRCLAAVLRESLERNKAPMVTNAPPPSLLGEENFTALDDREWRDEAVAL
jgi:hypothetical protein